MKHLIYPFGCSQFQHFTRSYVHSGFSSRSGGNECRGGYQGSNNFEGGPRQSHAWRSISFSESMTENIDLGSNIQEPEVSTIINDVHNIRIWTLYNNKYTQSTLLMNTVDRRQDY